MWTRGSELDMVQLHMVSRRNGPTASRRGMASDLVLLRRRHVLRRRRNDGNTIPRVCRRKPGRPDRRRPLPQDIKWPIMTRPTRCCDSSSTSKNARSTCLHHNSKHQDRRRRPTLSAQIKDMSWNAKSRNRSRSPSGPSPRPRREPHPSPKPRPRPSPGKPVAHRVRARRDARRRRRSGSSPLLMIKVLRSNPGRNGRRVPVAVSVDATTARRNNTNARRTRGTILLDY